MSTPADSAAAQLRLCQHRERRLTEYDDREDGMKPVDDMLKDVSYDAVDFGDGCDATIDDKIIGV